MSLPPPHPNSIALVTGASSGIGEQFARQLVERGYRVALVARTQARLDELASELGGEAKAVAIPADLADAGDRERLAARIEELGGQVEILVNCAGYGIYRPFGEAGRDAEVNQVRLLVEAPVDLMARYVPGMARRRRGAIINVSSTAGLQALPFNAGYAAAKGHLLLLSEAVHMELKDEGVTVTAVCPGPVPSGFQAASDAGYFAERCPSSPSARRSASRATRCARRNAARSRSSPAACSCACPSGPTASFRGGPCCGSPSG
jgi:short-subunit dehydrogenase